MGINIISALQEAIKEELIDIIEERAYLDFDFRRAIKHRLSAKIINTEEQIREFQRQVAAEMKYRSPDSSVIRSAGFALQRNMQSWYVDDFCRACVAIIRTFDNALCNGAGMEDDTDSAISMDLEEASDNAVESIKSSNLSDSERQEIFNIISAELKAPLYVCGNDGFTNIRDALKG